MSVVGFDLGNHSCYIAIARAGGIETVANDYSLRETPSCVGFTNRTRLLGVAARNQLVTNPRNTIYGFKRLLGRKYKDPYVENEQKYFSYDTTELQDGSLGIKAQYLNEEHVFTPQQVTAMVFTKLKETAEQAFKSKVVDCVVSVPSFATDAERRALLDAAQMAGLNVLKIMNDTTAALLAYGIYKQDLPAPEEKPKHVVLVDIGQSCIQVVVGALNKGKLKVLAVESEPTLGGRNFDRILVDHFTEEFKTKYKVDAKTKIRAYLRLFDECEKLKKLMSANTTEIPINIECFMEEKDVSGRMSRATFEKMSTSLLQRVETTFRNLLAESKLKIDDIDSIEIVGGSSRVPAIKKLVHMVFGQEPSTTLNQDEAVSRGCALQCALLSPSLKVREFSITDVQPYPVELRWKADKDEDGEMEVFNKFHQMPFSKMLTFFRKEPFTITAKYVYPNDIPYPDTHIGDFIINNVTPNAAKESQKVKVKVRINLNGIFTVSSASLMEKSSGPEDNNEEPMDIDDNDKSHSPTDENNMQNGPKDNSKSPVKEETMDTEKTKEPVQEDQYSNHQAGDQSSGDQYSNQQSGDQWPNEKSADSKGKKETTGDKKMQQSPSKKGKKIVKSVELPIESRVPQLNKEQLNLYFEKESKMIMQDKLEKEKADAKNSLEEYVYEMRNKISDELEQFVSETDRDNFSKLLEETENWLYDEGEDQSKVVYYEKYTQLKKLGQPIVDRYHESHERPGAFEELGATLQLARKAVDLYHQKDEKYTHIPPDEMDKVRKAINEKQEWLDRQMNLQAKQPPYVNPVVLASQVRKEKELFVNIINPILFKPKPKPKEQPPKDDPKVKSDNESEDSHKANLEKEEPQQEKQEKGEMDID